MTEKRRNPTKVVLLHGLGRASLSMAYLANQLAKAGYDPVNLSYPSFKYPVEKLATDFVLPAILNRDEPTHFVTHSLGGIIVRQIADSNPDFRIGRVVMLAPPNAGSEVAETLSKWAWFRAFNGPAGEQLGTSAKSLPKSLGPAPFQLGIIAGNRTVNPLLSRLIEGENDGRFSVENAKLEGMADFLVLPVSHPFIMLNKTVSEETIHFLEHGAFQGSEKIP
ncbi:MAG: alpha/beta fold hydrolase [Anaerolineae bacterium]|jgi:alpha-beta hydrolase superfamily lysophospholipase|nr:alpha/beta fold hydrolase [Anaerolineae bacterium]MBT3714501.1 alpha/beta fold hydrolase [Anaerolineae bacterium]MBT4308893.1 alpha/beta fold hydrolase [Anaerolineae bacterium]MBT4459044.1 alpha/beta fold hydrolase [Anaerolineae bacterium]MBT6060126.1 alpha/beta fold hydrolase [Anaerolineae bacterium]